MTGSRLFAAAGMCVAVLTGCANDATVAVPSPHGSTGAVSPLVGKSVMRIGVEIDLPGISEIVNHNPMDRRGLDIDIATYVANGLGAQRIQWYDVTSQNREQVIQNGDVDLVVAAYIINEERLDKVSFAG